jgi:hypothetical protein
VDAALSEGAWLRRITSHMSSQVNAWLSDFEALVERVHAREAHEARRYTPEIQALVERAYQYQLNVYTTTRIMSDHFIVTEHEYKVLQRYLDHDDSETSDRYPEQLRIWGMRVCRSI